MICTFDKTKIQDYLDNLLSPEERQEVETHLAACPECHREWVEMGNLMELLGDLPVEELPEGFKEELHEKLIRVVQEQPEEKKHLLPLRHMKKHFRAYSAAAAVLLIGVVTVGSMNLWNRPAGNDLFNTAMEAPSAAMDQAPAEEEAKLKMQDSAARSGAPASPEMENAYGGGGAPVEPSAPAPAPAPADSDNNLQSRKVIRSGSASLSTLNYDTTIEALTAYANKSGGYVENLYTGDQYNPMGEETALKNGSITLRVPTGQFDSFFKTLETYGKVTEKSLAADDISAQYRDTYNQAVNLEVREAKLREIMETAKTVEDVMAVEAELSRVRGEINQLKGTLQQWDALVNLSRITVNVTEVRSLETQVTGLDKSLMTRIREAFIASVNSVIAGTENLAVWLVAAVPWLLMGGVLVLVLWKPMKRIKWIRRK